MWITGGRRGEVNENDPLALANGNTMFKKD